MLAAERVAHAGGGTGGPALGPGPHDARADLLPLLDEAIARLSGGERRGVLLWFFHGMTCREAGAAMGVSEEAARKRVARGVERMRQFFADRGVTGVTSAAVAATMLNESAVATSTAAATAALVQSTVNVALLSASAAASAAAAGPAGAIAKGVSHMLMLFKLKVAAAAACAAIVVAGAAVTATSLEDPKPLTQAKVVATHEAKADEDEHVVALDNGAEVRFLGVCRTAQEQWFTLAGKKIREPANPFGHDGNAMRHEAAFAALIHVSSRSGLPSTSVRVRGVDDVRVYVLDDGPNAHNVMARFDLPDGQSAAEITVLVGEGEWQTIGTTQFDPDRRGATTIQTPQGAFAIMQVGDFGGLHGAAGGEASFAKVATDFKSDEAEWSVFAVDNAGAEVFCDNVWEERVGSFQAILYQYGVPPERVSGFSARVRPYEQKITVRNATLSADKPSQPTIVVEKLEPVEKK